MLCHLKDASVQSICQEWKSYCNGVNHKFSANHRATTACVCHPTRQIQTVTNLHTQHTGTLLYISFIMYRQALNTLAIYRTLPVCDTCTSDVLHAHQIHTITSVSDNQMAELFKAYLLHIQVKYQLWSPALLPFIQSRTSIGSRWTLAGHAPKQKGTITKIGWSTLE